MATEVYFETSPENGFSLAILGAESGFSLSGSRS